MPENSMIYTHRHFTFGYNNDRIVEVNMTASDPQLIEPEKYAFLIKAHPQADYVFLLLLMGSFTHYLRRPFQSLFRVQRCGVADPLVQHFQLLHDRVLLGGFGDPDYDAYSEVRLSSVCQQYVGYWFNASG